MTSERTVLVAGGARGIGRSIAEHLTGIGWKVVVTYNGGLDEASELKRSHGVEVRQLDLTDQSRTLDFSRQIRDEFPFDGLVNNAGILEKEAFEESTLDAWDRSFEVNVTAALIFAREIGLRMPAGREHR
jgi:NAD(P)-dependent dehydrogenase (short-subunit alcohol dehydrogenase family)